MRLFFVVVVGFLLWHVWMAYIGQTPDQFMDGVRDQFEAFRESLIPSALR